MHLSPTLNKKLKHDPMLGKVFGEETASRFVRVFSTTFHRLLPERVCRNICYRRGESVQIYTYLCAFIGDSAPPLKKGEKKKKAKKVLAFLSI
jgi:ribosome biogenesis protein Nip4